MHNCLFTEDRVVHLGLSNGICTICNNDRETLKHLFFDCNKAKTLIGEAQIIINRITTNVHSNSHILLNYENMALGVCDSKLYRLINTVILETKWCIWIHRNKCKHDGMIPNVNQFIYMLKYNLKFQLMGKNIKSYFPNGIEENLLDI